MQVLVITLTDKETGVRDTLRIERDSVKDLHKVALKAVKPHLYKREFKNHVIEEDEGIQEELVLITKAADLPPGYLVDLIQNKGPLEESAVEIKRDNSIKHRIPKVKAINCHGCGDIIVGKFETGDLFECRNCNSTQIIEDIFDFGEYICTCCGTSAYLGLTSESYEYVTCKQCQAPIDFIWHAKNKKYISMNMTGH